MSIESTVYAVLAACLQSPMHNGREGQPLVINIGPSERFDLFYDSQVIALDISDIWEGIL